MIPYAVIDIEITVDSITKSADLALSKIQTFAGNNVTDCSQCKSHIVSVAAT